MATTLETVGTVVGAVAGSTALAKLVDWFRERSATGAASAEKRDERDHAFSARMVDLLERQNAASAQRVDQYVTAINGSTVAQHEVAASHRELVEAVNTLSDRIAALEGRPTPRPLRPRSLTPAPTSATQPPAPPATGEHPVGSR